MAENPNPRRAPLIDAHAHLDSEDYQSDLEDVVERARSYGVTSIVSIGIEPDDWPRTLSIAEHFPDVYPAIGVHPNSADQADEANMAQIESICRSATGPRLVGLGGDRPRLLQAVRFP